MFEIYQAFAEPADVENMRKRFAEGIGWGELKQELFEFLDAHLRDARQEYDRLIADPGHVEAVLKKGGARARRRNRPRLARQP